MQQGERRRHHRGERGRERHQPDGAGLQPGQRGHLLLRRPQPGRDRVCMFQQGTPSVGQQHAAGAAHDQRRPHLPFQRLHVLADRRLGEAELPRAALVLSGATKGPPPPPEGPVMFLVHCPATAPTSCWVCPGSAPW